MCFTIYPFIYIYIYIYITQTKTYLGVKVLAVRTFKSMIGFLQAAQCYASREESFSCERTMKSFMYIDHFHSLCRIQIFIETQIARLLSECVWNALFYISQFIMRRPMLSNF